MGWLVHLFLNGGEVYVECYILKTGMERIVHGHHDQIVGTDQIPVWLHRGPEVILEVVLYANNSWNSSVRVSLTKLITILLTDCFIILPPY